MDTPPLPFRGDPPDRDRWVLGQAVAFNPARWKALLSDLSWWPVELDGCPRGRKGWPLVDRRTVLEISERAQTPLGAVQTFVASSVFGSGTQAREVARRGRVLADAGLPEKLAEAMDVMVRRGPANAYMSLDLANKIKHLGPLCVRLM